MLQRGPALKGWEHKEAAQRSAVPRRLRRSSAILLISSWSLLAIHRLAVEQREMQRALFDGIYFYHSYLDR